MHKNSLGKHAPHGKINIQNKKEWKTHPRRPPSLESQQGATQAFAGPKRPLAGIFRTLLLCLYCGRVDLCSFVDVVPIY